MSSDEPSDRERRIVDTGCPHTDDAAAWDTAAWLRGPIFAPERLEEHAAEVASAHGAPSLDTDGGPFRERIADARARIRRAYRELADLSRNDRDPSPAEEWLLDNSHVVQDQLREIDEDLPSGYLAELPRLRAGYGAGFPRVYALSLDYLRHTDGRIDPETLARYVVGYQKVSMLTVGELWAVPIMLRVGLVLMVGAVAVAEIGGRERARADGWADRLIAEGGQSDGIRGLLRELDKEVDEPSAAFVVQLLRRMRGHDAPMREVHDWIAARCDAMGTGPDDLSRQEHLRQAADQVSVGNAITSMRAVSTMDWNRFFERTSVVEEVLAEDPTGTYCASDEATRDRCRHAIEAVAARSRVDEAEVARTALRMAKDAHGRAGVAPERGQVEYYLIDDGRAELEAAVGCRPPMSVRLRRGLTAHATPVYLGAVALTSLVLVTGLLAAVASVDRFDLLRLTAIAVLAAWPASELAMALVNALVTALLPPRLLPKLALKTKIPDDCRTLVAVPVLVGDAAELARLFEQLEVRSLANAGKNIHFALLTDFPDAPQAERDGDADLLAFATKTVEALNAKYPDDDGPRFWLLHRRRRHNPSEGCWMAWERKRGKLEELNRLLRGATDTSFTVVTAPPSLLASIRYVVTLDADTELPRGAARRLVATMAHPLNEPRIDPERGCVVRGYGIVQPRVGTLLRSSGRSRFARIMAGPAGVDPYTTAISDVYQDLFGEGSFVGKGIYDVDAFAAALDGRVPENSLLSHDLFEGLFARTALASDIELLDEQPASYAVHASREHRWVRGDWQLLPWLLGPVPAGARRSGRARPSFLGHWKLFDNLRRSLVPPAMIGLLALAWWSSHAVAAIVTFAVVLCLATPLYARLAVALLRPASDRAPSFVEALRGEVRDHALQVAVSITFLLDRAWLMIDAITRTLYRRYVSGRRLLEWRTTSQSEGAASKRGGLGGRGLGIPLCAAAMVALLAWRAPGSLPIAAPLLVLWAASPFLARWLSRIEPPRDRASPLSADDRRVLRLCARKTWRFFETFVTAEDNWLPPDNFQEQPRPVVAHRTSPTNVGLYLLSVVAARDFGFITISDLAGRLEATLSTLEKLEGHKGHILNWYDTTTLKPLDPHYVSTVDSGNLAAFLWTLTQACEELCDAPIVPPTLLEATRDALILSERSNVGSHADVHERIAAASADDLADLARAHAFLRELERRLQASDRDAGDEGWAVDAGKGLTGALEEIERLAPWARGWTRELALSVAPGLGEGWTAIGARLASARSLSTLAAASAAALDDLRSLRSSSEAAAASPALQSVFADLEAGLTRSVEETRALKGRLQEIARRSAAFADGINFDFLYDPDRALFSIGFNVGAARFDPSHYDLLASEARLATLVAIAKGDAPQEHWFRLGRPRTALRAGRVLLSWSGTMFEYLMPLLVTKSFPSTLLAETYEACVGAQRDYGDAKGVPWGISECAFNTMDLAMNYQYRAFGDPNLGFKAGLAEDLVVAPYATVLAALVRPDLAAENLRALGDAGMDGAYGYYESIDFTPTRVPPGRHGVVVKTFMAHHQGMSLVALDNVLHDDPMPRRLHADPRFKSIELLLQERVPVGTPLVARRTEEVGSPTAPTPDMDVVDHVTLAAEGPLRAHLLGQGELSTIVTATGTGVTTWKDADLHRFREDPSVDPSGIFVYVRDVATSEVWSAGFQPTRRAPDAYDVAFAVERVEIRRRDGDIETLMEVVVSPEAPAELRRLTVTNHGAAPREIEITTYMEIVLAPRSADLAHRAFSGLFVETEAHPERSALIARRRPRGVEATETWLVQVLAPLDAEWSPVETECSRSRFLGRGGTPQAPAALAVAAGPLSGTSGTTLDPVFALRRRTVLEPGKSARLALTTGVAPSREAALDLATTYGDPAATPRTFELGWIDVRVELRHLGTSAAQAQRFQRLLSAMLDPVPALRRLPPGPADCGARGSLFAHGVSGDLPILAVRLDGAEFGELLKEVLEAHEFWRINGFASDLVILNEEPSGYLQPRQEQVHGIVRASSGQQRLDQRGGVFALRSEAMPAADREAIHRVARVILASSGGSLARQLRDAVPSVDDLPRAPRRIPARPPPSAAPAVPSLAFDNEYGGFAEDGAYVVRAHAAKPTPLPWCNVLANPRFGCVVSESGGGFTWSGNSQSHRLTPWSNDWVADPVGEAVYLRDDTTGAIWSATPAPAGGDAPYVVRHGRGFTAFEHDRGEIVHTLTVFTDKDDPIKVSRLELRNRGSEPKTLTVFGVVEWVLGGVRDKSRLTVETSVDPRLPGILARNPFSVFPARRAFFATTGAVAEHTADRAELFGRDGSRARPAGLAAGRLSGRTGTGLDPCAALGVAVELAPGASVEIAFLLGEGDDEAHARDLAARYVVPGRVAEALADVDEHWRTLLETVTVSTPDPALDTMMNGWLLYQSLACRIWGRSALYQSGGAFGFRDQLQDVMALFHTRPAIARDHLLVSAQRQFVEGDVQHWWHPDTGEGVRTHCSDDMLWLPYVAAAYAKATGDHAVFDEVVPFLTERLLEPAEGDIFSAPAVAAESATLYEHCVRALRRGATAGEHGLPLMGAGDWNDGMNRVGVEGRGESVWMAWFFAKTLRDFSPIARARGDAALGEWIDEQIERLRRAVDEHAWDGEWYRRAYFDDGSPLGAKENAECRIDAIAQSWAVLSKLGDPARAASAARAAFRHLVRRGERMMLLFGPPFTGRGPDPGYIRAYPPGVRENGGQYTHGVLWSVWAAAELGDGDDAGELLSLLNPIRHAESADAARKYAVEPYVVAADVYAADGYEGRGGWTWYTGSAAWMYRIALENVLGVRLESDHLMIAPCVPRGWKRYEVSYRRASSTFHIVVEDPQGKGRGVARITVDGKPAPNGKVPLVDDGRTHEVRVVLGDAQAVAPVAPPTHAPTVTQLNRRSNESPSYPKRRRSGYP